MIRDRIAILSKAHDWLRNPAWGHECENFLQTGKHFAINNFCLQESRGLCFQLCRTRISFWYLSYLIIPWLCLDVLFCGNTVTEVNTIIIEIWFCPSWKHRDIGKDSRDSVWSPPLFLWFSYGIIAKETSSSSPPSLQSSVLPWVIFQTPDPRMAITEI